MLDTSGASNATAGRIQSHHNRGGFALLNSTGSFLIREKRSFRNKSVVSLYFVRKKGSKLLPRVSVIYYPVGTGSYCTCRYLSIQFFLEYEVLYTGTVLPVFVLRRTIL